MFGFRRQQPETVPEQMGNAPVLVRDPQPVVVATAGNVMVPSPVVLQPVAAPPTVTVTTVPSRWDQFRLGVWDRIQDIFWFIFSIAALLIVVRFCLIAFAAGTSNTFAVDILSWSGPLVAPFRGLFHDPSVPNIAHFELADAIALFVYAVATGLVCQLVALLLSPRVPSRRVIVTRN